MSYACFTVSYCISTTMHGIYYVKIINRQNFRWLLGHTKWVCKKLFCTQICTYRLLLMLKKATFLEQNGGVRLWITKWTLNTINWYQFGCSAMQWIQFTLLVIHVWKRRVVMNLCKYYTFKKTINSIGWTFSVYVFYNMKIITPDMKSA